MGAREHVNAPLFSAMVGFRADHLLYCPKPVVLNGKMTVAYAIRCFFARMRFNKGMHYIIDGHNLIPHIPGMNLRQMDDEQGLIALLQAFCRAKRASVDVYFDGAPPGQPAQRAFGAVKAHFVRAGRTADDAIRAHLGRLGARAREVSVVTSDRQVQREGRDVHAKVIGSDEFARLLAQTPAAAPGSANDKSTADETDIDEWLRLFGEKRG